MTAKALPRNQEAEEAVIGAILYAGRSALHAVLGLLRAEDLHHPTLRAIYSACVELDDGRVPITLLTVADHMRRDGSAGTLKAYGGEAYLAELSSRVTVVDTIAVHADLIREAALRRRLIEVGAKLQERALGGQEDAEALLGSAQTDLAGVAGGVSSRSVDVGVDFEEEYREILERARTPGVPRGIPSGFCDLDMLTGGFQPGELIVVAARPSMGKTAFKLQVTDHAAYNAHPALFFSAEMGREAIRRRRFSIEGLISASALKTGGLSQQDLRALDLIRVKWKNVPLRTNDTARPSLAYLRSEAYRWRSDPRLNFSRPGMIGVDYLQLVKGTDRGKQHNREQEIAEVSAGLKALAKELGVVVVAGAQLNREVEKRGGKRPTCADLRESGAIEQDADVILFIHREEKYDPDTPNKGIAEIIIGKNREGATGTARMLFRPEFTRFDDLSRRSGT